MEEWKKYKLGDIIHLIGGGTPKTTIDSFWNGDIPWLSVKDFNNSEKYVYQTEKSISKLGLEKSTTRLLQKNDIIISARGTVGEIAMLPFPMAFNQSCYGIRGDLDIIDQDYLYYLMKFKLAEIKSKTHGSVFDTITRDTFGNINCSLPAFNIQQKISNILSSFDDKIALNKRINDNLEQQALAIYRSWFVDFEPFKGGKFIDSELGKIPEEWKVGTLKDFVYIKYGKDHKKLNDGVIPVYGSGGIMRYVDQSLYSGESILIPRKGTLNNVFYVNESFWSVDTMFYTQMKMNNIAKYIYFFASTQNLASMNAGSAVPSMTTEILNSLKCIMAPLEIMEKFNVLQNPIFDTIRKNEGENEKLSNLRDTLLPQLMSGELKITDLNS